MVQWLRIHLPMQGDTGLIPGRESTFCSINPNFLGLWAYCSPNGRLEVRWEWTPVRSRDGGVQSVRAS